jgi:hypothetical protein
VLGQGRGGIQKTALFGKRPSPNYGKNSSNKQRKIIVYQYGKYQELLKFLQVQLQNTSSAMMRTATGMEDLLQRINSLELPASENAAQINASQSSRNRHISTSTVQRRL